MPKVICSHCGEELMGSVNRCWRCGRTFVAEHNPENLPPIRQRPIPLELVNKSFKELAELAAARQPVAGAAGGQATTAGEPIIAELIAKDLSEANAQESSEAIEKPALAGEVHHPPAAVAAPANTAWPASPAPRTPNAPYYTPPPTPIYPTNAGATGGAIASIVLGVMALATIKLLTPGALLISILGVAMGVWGLYSDRRTAAVIGLLLCCLAMSISGFLSAVELFELINGYSPFEGDLPPIDTTAI